MSFKAGTFAKRIYLPRIIGSGVGFWSIAAALIALPTPSWVWMLLIFHGYVWPHIAYLCARRVPIPYIVERRNMLVESGFGGLWVIAMDFNALPSTMLVSMLCMNCIAVGGFRLLKASLTVLGVGGIASAVILRPHFSPETSAFQVYACLPMLAVYPLAVGAAAYRLGAKLAAHKRAFRDFSRLDSMTGLLNQGAWRAMLDDEYALASRGRAVTTLALIDIDHFKAINDRYGHLIGDEVIKLFSKVMIERRRSTDIAGRVGGDEFGLIFRGTNTAEAGIVLAQLKHHLLDAFATRKDLPTVTLSIGTAEYTQETTSVEAWITACDHALYAAKRQGRDRVICASNTDGQVMT